jgi:hypothetical protein
MHLGSNEVKKNKTFERGESGKRDRVIPPQHAKAARAGSPGDRGESGDRKTGASGNRSSKNRVIGISGRRKKKSFSTDPARAVCRFPLASYKITGSLQRVASAV